MYHVETIGGVVSEPPITIFLFAQSDHADHGLGNVNVALFVA